MFPIGATNGIPNQRHNPEDPVIAHVVRVRGPENVEDAIAVDVAHPVLPEALVRGVVGKVRGHRRQREAECEASEDDEKEPVGRQPMMQAGNEPPSRVSPILAVVRPTCDDVVPA